ncbi:hypothetical protein BABINDRAFT_160862 [Babjeviella inositovora NRRL Y-12698]|uniref:Autophagy-related protein 16 domain-containing protein n=1 Tax=Babjeviella inositovora NRRL Y-12698 TaxID=984486 RepID=A0A1E3QSC6_9ASCO|nr:uncharacterized protein BABINDRAFT_160862 [Babjeviella inositovora NRRL Y-12698]ODQ80605.1 hypothetical protein BABINDRAFT_160862 [Babjeviella inositovora NRRL Y-12698]
MYTNWIGDRITNGFSAKAQQKSLAKLQKEFAVKLHEMQEKNKAIELANDTVLSLEIENNVLADRIAALESENELLITRWIAKVSADAQKLNEANETLAK